MATQTPSDSLDHSLLDVDDYVL
ncbi:hypothetical protein A2U01_0075396, partial [Trifolium medium]|nr:hypothetical protein [Trifolium medium]